MEKNILLERTNIQETSYSEKTFNNLMYVEKIIPTSDSILVGTGSTYSDPRLREMFGEAYKGDLDFSISRDYIRKNPEIGDVLFSENFVMGAITEEIDAKRRKVLPDSYVFMKYDEGKNNKIIDVLFGFHLSSPWFYRGIKDRKEIKRISKKRKIGDSELYVLKPMYQLAEKVMLPEKKRTISFDRIFQLLLLEEFTPTALAEEVAYIIKEEYLRDGRDLNRWWDEIKKFDYVFGNSEIRSKKRRFFTDLRKKLKI